MIADYDLLKNKLLSELQNKLKKNYMLGINDVEDAFDRIKDSVTSPIVIPTKKLLLELEKLSIDELKTEIKECLDSTTSGRYERDNLIILDALARELSEKLDINEDYSHGSCGRCWYNAYICSKRPFAPAEFNTHGWATSMSVQGCLHEMADDKSNMNEDILLCGTITYENWTKDKTRITQEIFRYMPPKEYIFNGLHNAGVSDDVIEKEYGKAKYINLYTR